MCIVRFYFILISFLVSLVSRMPLHRTPRSALLYACSVDSKQLLDEVEHDIINYQNRGLCYLPKPKAEADNTDTRV